MTKEEQQKDDIETMKILFNADINELCNQRRFNDAREMEGIRDRIIKALEQQPSEDCVKREDVKSGMIKYGFLAPDMTVTEFVEDCLPSVTPERPKGKWIEVLEWRTEFSSAWHYECSECRARSYKGYKPLERYCPKCGAEMEGGKDENNFGR